MENKHVEAGLLALHKFKDVCDEAAKAGVCMSCFLRSLLGSVFATCLHYGDEEIKSNPEMAEALAYMLYDDYCARDFANDYVVIPEERTLN